MKNLRNSITAATLFALSLGTIGSAQAALTTIDMLDNGTGHVDVLNFDTSATSLFQFTVGTSGIINDLNLELQITNSAGKVNWGSWEIVLSHLGTDVTVFNPPDSSDSAEGLFDVIFDDAGDPGAILGIPPANDIVSSSLLVFHFLSFGALSGFDGLNVQGLWELSILDISGVANGDNLLKWNLIADLASVPASAAPEPGILSLIGAGLLGMGFIRRRRLAKA